MIYREPIPSLKIEGRQPDSPAIIGGTMSCHNDKPRVPPTTTKPPNWQSTLVNGYGRIWSYRWLSGKLWYLQHICVGDTIVYRWTSDMDHLNIVIDCHVFCERTCNVFTEDNLDTGKQRAATMPPCRHPRQRRLSFWQPAMSPETTKSAPRQLSALSGRTSCGDIC